MEIYEKIERLIVLPKRIAEYERNRSRLLEAKSPDFGDKPSSGSKTNSSEDKSIKYADYGKQIDELKKERAKLAIEIQKELDEKLPGEQTMDIELREVMKSSFIDFKTIEMIGKAVIFRSKNYTSDLFHLGCAKLAIPKETIDQVRRWSRKLAQLDKNVE